MLTKMATLASGAFYGRVGRQWSSELATVSVLHHESPRTLPDHSHERAFLTLLLRGRYREEAGGTAIAYGPLSLVFHPEGLVHRDEIGAGGASFFTIEVARELLTDAMRGDPGLRSLRDLGGGKPVWTALELLRSTLDHETSAVALEEPAAEILDGLVEATRPAPLREPRWLAAVDAALEQRYAEALSLVALAREASVHPVHLSHVFRQVRGHSLRATLHRLRVREAWRLLEEGRPLAEIARATGFVDQSHLTHVFRRVAGRTPGSVRALVRRALAS
jgi:AraC family transcriptional regulator